MKKTILIIIGTLLILIILGVWAYLFTFGSPKNGSEVFSNFGIGGNSSDVAVHDSVVDVQDINIAGKIQKLKQLTVRPVAGASFVDGGIRYVEQGTGHIYQINTANGSESLISGTTLPGAREAVFSRNGASVAITLLSQLNTETLVGTLASAQGGSFVGKKLPAGATEIHFGEATSTLYYLLKDESGSVGYAYDVQKETTVQLFSIPLRDIHVIWGETTYVYTVPTAMQRGSLYEVSKNRLRYVTAGGYGLMGIVHHATPITTVLADGVVYSLANLSEGNPSVVPITVIPEKCISGSSYLYCSAPEDLGAGKRFPDDWYMGSISYSDVLWRIDIREGKATVLSNFLTETGREVDVLTIGIAPDESALYFINKNDNALWMFDLQ